ncbi:MAG: CapA family protein [Coriobacteriales bacterium]|nr:CapA family protein [Coriobacteriales bacterium]
MRIKQRINAGSNVMLDRDLNASLRRRALPVILRALLLVFFALSVLSSACAAQPRSVDKRLEDLTSTSRPFNPDDMQLARPAPPVELRIVSVGDIMLHYPDQRQYDSDGQPVFADYFRFTAEVVQTADIALCNIEAPFGGGTPAGYPIFNMADEMAPAVAAAGFDVVYTTNNHMLDQGSEGVLRTVSLLRESGLLVAGSRLEENEPAFVLYNTKGLDIAVVAYTYETTTLGSTRSINGIPMAEDLDPLINSYTSGSAADKDELRRTFDAARAAGAELLVCYFHNGTEYAQAPNDDQREMAQYAADAGADVIFASHPHVLQPMEFLMPAEGEVPVPVFWAMGNYVSNQRLESGMDAENEQGIMADVRISYNSQHQQIDEIHMDYLPLWVDRYSDGTRPVHTVIPERGDLAENSALATSGHLDRALAAFVEIHELLGEAQTWKRAT